MVSTCIVHSPVMVIYITLVYTKIYFNNKYIHSCYIVLVTAILGMTQTFLNYLNGTIKASVHLFTVHYTV